MMISGIIISLVAALFGAIFYNIYAEQTSSMWDSRAPIDTILKYDEAKGKIRRGETVTKEEKELVISRDGLTDNGSSPFFYDRYGRKVDNITAILVIIGILISWYGLLLRYRCYKTMVISGVFIVISCRNFFILSASLKG